MGARIRAKYDPSMEQEAMDWIAELVGTVSPKVIGTEGEVMFQWLKNGVYLCHLLNKIKPGTVQTIVEQPRNVLEERQNIQVYLTGCIKLNVPGQDMFTIGDLHSCSSISAVLQNIYALGRQAQVTPGYRGPTLGVSYSVTAGELERREQKKAAERDRRATLQRQKSDQEIMRRNELEDQERDAKITEIEGSKNRSLTRQLSKGRISLKQFRTLSDQNLKEIQTLKDSKDELEVKVTYGMDLEIKNARKAKYDTEREDKVMDWIEGVTGEHMSSFYDDLKDGQILCKLVNCFRPNMIKRINTRDTPLSHRDNIQMYLSCLQRMGISTNDLFTVNDFYEQQDMIAFLKHFFTVSRRVEQLRLIPGPFLQLDGTISPGVSPVTSPRNSPPSHRLKSVRTVSVPNPSTTPIATAPAPAPAPEKNESVKRIVEKPIAQESPKQTESPGRKKHTRTPSIVITPESPARLNASARKSEPPTTTRERDLSQSVSELPLSKPTIQFHRTKLVDMFFPRYWISGIFHTVADLRFMFCRG